MVAASSRAIRLSSGFWSGGRIDEFGSHEDTKAQRDSPLDIEQLCSVIVDCGYRLHRDVGPGLLESAYEMILANQLETAGFKVNRQLTIDIIYNQQLIGSAFRLDLLVGDRVIIELKSNEQMQPVFSKQEITYLRMTGLTHGFVMNFGMTTFKDGCRRLLNDPNCFVPLWLCANQNPISP
jgi:GxxExxY protein